MKTLHSALLSMSILFALTVSSAKAQAFGGIKYASTGPSHLLIVLDMTASFHPYWAQSCDRAAVGVEAVSGGTRVTVVGISASADSGDVLVETTLPVGYLPSLSAKRRLVTTIRALQPRSTASGAMVNGKLRGKPFGTDLEGALDLAASLCAPTDKATVLTFTDFCDHPVHPGKSLNPMQFPANTRFKGLFVPAQSGLAEFQTRVGRWIGVLGSMGVRANTGDFLIPAVAAQANGAQLIG